MKKLVNGALAVVMCLYLLPHDALAIVTPYWRAWKGIRAFYTIWWISSAHAVNNAAPIEDILC